MSAARARPGSTSSASAIATCWSWASSHRRALGGPDPDSVTGRRLRGYREAFAAVGARIDDDRVLVGPASIDGGIAILNSAWEDGLRPTAVLAMSDAMAIGAMRALRDLRLDVPGDVSVVGFDDIDLAPHVDPPLTTVHQPIRRKGEEAVRLLLSVVERRDLAKPEHRRLETRLIVRASTGPVPSAPGGGGRRPRLRSNRRATTLSSVRLANHERTETTAAHRGDHRPESPARPVGTAPTSCWEPAGDRPSGSREETTIAMKKQLRFAAIVAGMAIIAAACGPSGGTAAPSTGGAASAAPSTAAESMRPRVAGPGRSRGRGHAVALVRLRRW